MIIEHNFLPQMDNGPNSAIDYRAGTSNHVVCLHACAGTVSNNHRERAKIMPQTAILCKPDPHASSVSTSNHTVVGEGRPMPWPLRVGWSGAVDQVTSRDQARPLFFRGRDGRPHCRAVGPPSWGPGGVNSLAMQIGRSTRRRFVGP